LVVFTGQFSGCRKDTVWNHSSEDPSVLSNLLYSGARAIGKWALKTGSSKTDILHKQPEEAVGNIFKMLFGESKDNLEKKTKKRRGLDLL
jgi:hypothetical protein